MTPMELSVLGDLVARARLDREQAREKADREARTSKPVIRYATDEERTAARRRTYNRSKRRIYGTCACGARKAAHPSVKVCRACYLAAVEVEPAHGTLGRYASRTWRCRCVLCREASSLYHRNRRADMVAWKEAA